MKSYKVIFQTVAETSHIASSMEVAYSEHSISIQLISCYVTAKLAFACGEHSALGSSSFCDFLKMTFFDSSKPFGVFFRDVLNTDNYS